MISLILALLMFMFSSTVLGAINFSSGSSQYLNGTNTFATGAPFTVCAWFRPTQDTSSQVALWLGDKDVGTENYRMQLAGSVGGDPLRMVIQGAGTVTLDTSAGWTINTWAFGCIVEAAANDHEVFIDGGNSGTSTTSQTPSGVDAINIGRNGGTSPGLYFDGDIAEVGVWDIALTSANISDLYSNSWPPDCVESGNLVAYWPLIDNTDLTDEIGSVVLTANGSPSSATHPTINECSSGSPSPWHFLRR